MLRSYKLVIIILLPALFLLTKSASSAPSDVVAVRVMKNDNHYNVARWYKEKGFNGTLEPMKVDGYDAGKDGRTIYVGAGNAVDGKLYTNIYLMSVSQGADSQTTEIFSRLLKSWSFNRNIADAEQKAKIIRDVKRLGHLREIKVLLESYKAKNGTYPSMNAGSYVKNTTVSTWPSWKAFTTLIKSTTSIDPINTLGVCNAAGYNPKTCWNESAKRFSGTLSNNGIDLPAGSLAYAYRYIDSNHYRLCGNFESELNYDGDIERCD